MEETNVLAENIVTADLSNEKREVSVHGLSQWDYGQVLRVTGLKVDDGDIDVHFSLQRTGNSALVVTATVKDGVLLAPIPNILLTETCSRKIYVFIYLEDAESGQTIRNLTLFVKLRPKPEDYVYTETEVFSYKALADRVTALEENPVAAEQVQADWNQNDETALDYIKNRPFYTKDPVETVILEETSVETSTEMPASVSDIMVYSDSSRAYAQLLFSPPLTEGNTGIVIFNGDRYECKLATYYSVPCIGNLSLSGEGENTGEPFLIIDMYGAGIYLLVTEEVGTYTISISEIKAEVVGLPEKYISHKPGLKVGGETLTVNGEEMVASKGAEIFNDYEGNKATGEYSHAEGSYTQATGDCSHAEGETARASGRNSHAEGYNNVASGISSHAEGRYNAASGDGAHVEGLRNTASGEYQHVQGKYNIEDTENKYAHIVGNGSSGNKSNAHTLDWNGNAWFAGEIKIGGYGQEDSRVKTLATTEDVDSVKEYTNTQIDNKVADVEKKVTKNTEAIDTLNGMGDGSVSKQVSDAVAVIVNDAPEAYDTLREISDWISSHADSAATMNSNIAANATAIATEKIRAEAAETTLQTEIDTNTNTIEALETVVTGKANAEHTHEITDVTGLQDALDDGKNFVVNVTMGETTTADKTYDAIVEAYNSGRNVIAVLFSTTLPLLSVTSNEAQFGATILGDDHGNTNITSIMAAISSDNSVSFTINGIERFYGATSSAPGTNGFVPAPEAGDQDKFLKGDGTWSNVPSFVFTISGANVDNELVYSVDKTFAEIYSALEAEKQIICIINGGGRAFVINYTDSKITVLFDCGSSYQLYAINSDGTVTRTVGSDYITKTSLLQTTGASKFVPMSQSAVTTAINDALASAQEYADGKIPSVSTADNDKFLRVVNGAWAAVTVADAEGVSF